MGVILMFAVLMHVMAGVDALDSGEVFNDPGTSEPQWSYLLGHKSRYVNAG